MTRGRKIAAIVGGSLAGITVIGFLAGVIIVRTDWFRDMIRAKIVAAVEDSTGGKVEIGAFTFDWTHLRAQIRNFVIHGLEPAGAAPLLRANLVQADLKLLSPFKGFVDIAYLLVDTPQANVMVFADGRTNVPSPKVPAKSSDKTGIETVVDLAIGRFDLRNGSFTFAERTGALDASGENLRAQLGYNPVRPRYTGEIDISPLHVKSGSNEALDISVKLPVTMEKDKIAVTSAEIFTAGSKVVITGAMEHLIAPRTSAHLNAEISLDEVRRAAGIAMALDIARGPRLLNAEISGTMDDARIQLQSALVTVGQTKLEASGTLKDASRPAAVQFNSSIAVGELGRLLRVAARPEGTLKAAGNLTLDPNNRYLVTANVEGRQLAFTHGDDARCWNHRGFQLDGQTDRIAASTRCGSSALGGSFWGSAPLPDISQLQVAGNLHNFDIDQMTRALLTKPLGYDGVISGPVQLQGDLKNTATLAARGNLAIAPGRRGIPVSGHLGVDSYNGRNSGNFVTLGRSSTVSATSHARQSLPVRWGSRFSFAWSPAISRIFVRWPWCRSRSATTARRLWTL